MPTASDMHILARHHPILALLAINALAGALAAVVVVTGLVLLDVGGIGRLMARSDAPLLPFALMTFGFVVTLSSAAMGVAVMRLGATGTAGRGDGGGGHPVPAKVRGGR